MESNQNIKTAFLLLFSVGVMAQSVPVQEAFTVARLKYGGGGDWYNDPSCIPNVAQFFQNKTGLICAKDEVRISIMEDALFSFPFLFMTGHGRISFTEKEAQRLRTYLQSGGFLFADDDYGMDTHFRREMKKVFPEKEMVAIPFSHPIFSCFFSFPQGLPKIHEHDGGPPEAWGYFHDGRLVVFYAYNTNISDGWADPEVHKDPPKVREQALKMGTNILYYIMTN